jgi:hypothetical protein
MSTMPRRRNNRMVLEQYADQDAMHGNEATSAYLNSAQNFDASQALNQYAQGAWGGVAAGLRRELADVRGRSVGAGRFDSGFLDEDQGEVIERTAQNFGNSIAMQSMNAAQLQQQNDAQLGSFGERARGRAMDTTAAFYEQDENDRREEEERKRARKRGIAGAIGGVVGAAGGFLVGGPAGAAGGYKVGSAIGGGLY